MEDILQKYDSSLDHIFSKVPDDEYDELVGDSEEDNDDDYGSEKSLPDLDDRKQKKGNVGEMNAPPKQEFDVCLLGDRFVSGALKKKDLLSSSDVDEDVGAAALRRRYSSFAEVPDILKEAGRKSAEQKETEDKAYQDKHLVVKNAEQDMCEGQQSFQQLTKEMKQRQKLLRERHMTGNANWKKGITNDVASLSTSTRAKFTIAHTIAEVDEEEVQAKEGQTNGSNDGTSKDQEESSDTSSEEDEEEGEGKLVQYGYSFKESKFLTDSQGEKTSPTSKAEEEPKEDANGTKERHSNIIVEDPTNESIPDTIEISTAASPIPPIASLGTKQEDGHCKQKTELGLKTTGITPRNGNDAKPLSPIPSTQKGSNSTTESRPSEVSQMTMPQGEGTNSRVGQQAELIGIMKARLDERSAEIRKLLKVAEHEGKVKRQLEQGLEFETSRVKVLERRFKEINANHEELIVIKDEYKTRNSELIDENNDLREENTLLRSSDKQKIIEELSAKIEFYKMKQNQGKEAQMNSKILKEELSKTENLLREEKEENIRMGKEVHKLQEKLLKQVEESDFDHRKLQVQIKDLNDKLAAVEMSKTGEQGRISSLQIENKTLKKDNELVTSEVYTKRAEVKRLEEKVDSLEMKLVQAENKIHDHKISFENRCAKLVKEQSSQIRKKLSEADEKVRKMKLEYEAFKKHSNGKFFRCVAKLFFF